jgi:flagellar biosynthesis protein
MKPEKPARAVALRYDRAKDGAPRVVAKGRGQVAEHIIALAREHGVPLHEDASLAATLCALDLETEIPPELYRAVAEVLSFIYRLNGKLHRP